MERTLIYGHTNSGRKVHDGFSDSRQVLSHADTITEVLARLTTPAPTRDDVFRVLDRAGISASQLCARCFQAQFRLAYGKARGRI